MTLTISPTNESPLILGAPPCEGGYCIYTPITFDGSGDDVVVDLSAIQQTGHFSAAQTIFVNNVDNAAVVKVTMSQSLQTFEVPIGGFAYMPILQPNPPKITFNCAVAITIQVQFINFFLPPVVWGPTIGGGGGGGVTGLNPNDHSGAIVAGGVAQIAIPANVNRKGFMIANPLAATEKLQVALGNTGHYFDLSPGATYESGAIFWTGDIYVVAATNAHAYTAYEGT